MSTPRSYLIIANLSKLPNIRSLLVSAEAFGVSEIFIVGQPKLAIHENFRIPCRRFRTLSECCSHVALLGAVIVGVEIMEDAKSIETEPFSGDTAFMLGNEGSGMSDKQIRCCDQFVYIPQHGGGTASLNVTAAGSIILQRFAQWSKAESRNSSLSHRLRSTCSKK